MSITVTELNYKRKLVFMRGRLENYVELWLFLGHNFEDLRFVIAYLRHIVASGVK